MFVRRFHRLLLSLKTAVHAPFLALDRKGSLLLLSLLIIMVVHSSAASGMATPSTAPANSMIWPECGIGCTGEDVMTIQLVLWSRNYATALNGRFDAQTVQAIKAFQAASSINPSGRVGQESWPALLPQLGHGDLGMAVVALQRLLIAHGANLVPTGEFNQQTVAAVKTYQTTANLNSSGVVGPRTWHSLLTTPMTVTPPPPVLFQPGPTLWGVDTAPPVTQDSLKRIIKKFGQPAFIGKYLNGTSFTPLSAGEAALIHHAGIRIMLFAADTEHDSGHAQGVKLAKQILARAKALHIPQGVAIFADVEPGSAIDANWIAGWYTTILHAGYIPGYYGNPYADHNFNPPFCTAATHDPELASKALLDIYEPMLQRTPSASEPLFDPSIPYCGSNPTGNVQVWQYGLSAGDHSANVDTDELKASVPLW
jgi:peptidoglycan hydrolase-like protein with peptidoglycan-binding domain